LAALAACLLAAGGCQVFGVLFGKALPDPPVPAKFVPEKRPTLVLAENYRSPTLTAQDADRVARIVAQHWQSRDVAPLVARDDLVRLRDRDPAAFAAMDVRAIARAVGAEQVVYVDLMGVGVSASPGSEILKGQASANVRVIDVPSGRVLFPLDATDGIPVGYETPLQVGRDRVTPLSVRGATLEGLGLRIARLFYKWQPDDSGEDGTALDGGLPAGG